jgi:hypothetical protein
LWLFPQRVQAHQNGAVSGLAEVKPFSFKFSLKRFQINARPGCNFVRLDAPEWSTALFTFKLDRRIGLGKSKDMLGNYRDFGSPDSHPTVQPILAPPSLDD